MNIGTRLETIASLVPQGAKLADIGTDHALLPVYLLEKKLIASAIAGDIAAGPCKAARNTVSMYGYNKQVIVRQGSGLDVLTVDEADTIVIAGMGANTIIEILSAHPEIAQRALLLLQPMTGADTLRKWLAEQGWLLSEEKLASENNHLYDILAARYVGIPQKVASPAERLIGTLIMQQHDPLLAAQFTKHKNFINKLLANMSHSEKAKASSKYQELTLLLQELEALADECNLK